MKLNRPLSPHLTIYKPQLTSTLSIFHRITGAFLAVSLLVTLCLSQACHFSLSFYPVYFVFANLNWILFVCQNFVLVAFSYHISNGIRHLLWDCGFFLDLPKVYTSGIAMLLLALAAGFYLLQL